MVASGHAQTGVTVDDARGLRGNRNIRKQATDEAGANCGAPHRADDRLRAVDDVVNEVAGLLPHLVPEVVVGHAALDDGEVTASRKRPLAAAQDNSGNVLAVIDIAPDGDEF